MESQNRLVDYALKGGNKTTTFLDSAVLQNRGWIFAYEILRFCRIEGGFLRARFYKIAESMVRFFRMRFCGIWKSYDLDF